MLKASRIISSKIPTLNNKEALHPTFLIVVLHQKHESIILIFSAMKLSLLCKALYTETKPTP